MPPEGLRDDCVCALALAVQYCTTEFDGEPLRLLNGSDPDDEEGGTRGEIERSKPLCPSG